jgi:succinate dehydrogenase subunit D
MDERGGRGTSGSTLGDVLDWSDARQVSRRRRRAGPRGPRSLVEAIAWALFSAGGFVSAILLPAQVAILGIAFPAGWLPDDALTYTRIHHLVANPLTKLYLLALVSLPLFHWAHRFRFAIHHQFGIGMKRLVAAGCYGAALGGTGFAIWALLRI